MNLIFLSVYAVWLVSEILINRLLKSNATDTQNLDKNTLKIIWATIIVTNSLSIIIANIYYFPIYSDKTFRFVGLIIILTGCILRFLSIRSLGRQFTADVTIRQGHQLKTDGMYKYLRHPSYSASLLSFAGFGISLNNWLSLILLLSAVTVAFNIRINVEETALINQFGPDYLDYKKKTYRLIPFLF